jgi:hypothetical protein
MHESRQMIHSTLEEASWVISEQLNDSSYSSLDSTAQAKLCRLQVYLDCAKPPLKLY